MGDGDEDMGADAARAHGEFLRGLGFPEGVVEGAVEARRAGLMDPDPALVAETARAAGEASKAHADELRSLGFPERAIDEAVRAREAGLFRTDPPPDLHGRIMEAVSKAMGWPTRRGDGG